ncbi:hypothetical protein N0V93_000186 [Gnomoniopsis smithogilvyi]|uniref:Pal1-like protein n=1 Tax=Gnomoniopsis smithogilvyi TaxID=1191159 RepID=A0A9W8Z1F6_9PEZI|nr:hypothetical protein N0V93_000186 [Gnomoniopsis smithogilvyi]
MSSAGWFRGRSFELIHTRSVFVRVNPTPTTLSERRAVLHALQRHGTVEVFKRLPAPSSFICAFVKRQEALDMIGKSPMTFKFVSEPLEPVQTSSITGGNPMSVASPITLHFIEGERDTIKREQADPSTAESNPIKTFTIWAKASEKSYNHKTNIRRNPIHGPWPEVKKTDHDFAYHALKEVVPDNIAQHGLCDWTTGGQLSEDVKLARADEGSGGNWQIRDRIERRRNRERASADGNELTSWTSLKAALQPTGDTLNEAVASTFGTDTKPVDNSVQEGFSSETVSEPLRMDNPLDSTYDRSEGQDSQSDQAPELYHQRTGGDSVPKSPSKETLQRILGMPTSSKKASSLNHDLGNLRSDLNDKDVAQDIQLGPGEDT